MLPKLHNFALNTNLIYLKLFNKFKKLEVYIFKACYLRNVPNKYRTREEEEMYAI